MNNIIVLVTLVGDIIIGSAQFDTWKECELAAFQVNSQPAVFAACTYESDWFDPWTQQLDDEEVIK